MKSKRLTVIGMGITAGGLAVAFLFLPPVRNRIIEEWYLRKLDSPDRIERRRAAERLANVQSTRAIPKIVALFPTRYEDHPPRWVPQALVRLGLTGAEAAFKLKLPDGRVHPEVFEGLRELGPAAKAAIPCLVVCLRSADDGLDAAFTLEGIGSEAVPPLVAALSTSEAEGRSNAAHALGKLGVSAVPAVPALIGALEDGESGIRKAAAEALGSIGPPALAACAALVTALEDDGEQEVRMAAAKALGLLGPGAKSALPALVDVSMWR